MSETDHEDEVLSDSAIEFLGELHRRHAGDRRTLLRQRVTRRQASDGTFAFLPETVPVRDGDWTVAQYPVDLADRRCEITGPTDRKMMINALNSGAKVFMADFEDSTAPTWANVIDGQRNCRDAVQRTLTHTNPDGKQYSLDDHLATLVIRPRGWHLEETHLTFAGDPASASLVDFGLYMFHNARALIESGSGPYFYLPKLEHHLEARLWNDVFVSAQEL
ncbi:MAG: malate synthase A, partial [Acidimicrobiia bacterium]|nr:malate synthase A [Acidimicrobiia bacterium]